jgi:hypothetical protein
MPDFGYGANKFQDLWRSTRTYYSEKIIDMLPRSHPLLDKIAGKGNFEGKKAGKGKRIVEPILARANENVRWVGFDQSISSTHTNLLEQIEWDWKMCMQDFIIYDKVLAINESDALVNLLKINQEAVREGFARTIARQLYSDGASPEYSLTPGLEMGGLQYLLSENPYKEGLIVLGLQRGGEDPRYEFWRNRAGEWINNITTPASSTWPATKEAQADVMIEAWNHMIDVCNYTNRSNIDAIFCNHFFYDLYIYYMTKRLQIHNTTAEKKDAGFGYVEFRGIPVYLDQNCPNNKIFFINSSKLNFNYLEGENFRQQIKELRDFFAHQYITTFIGNFTASSVRDQGVITLNTIDTAHQINTSNGLPDDCNICKFATYKNRDYQIVPQGQSTDSGFESTDYTGSGVYNGQNMV